MQRDPPPHKSPQRDSARGASPLPGFALRQLRQLSTRPRARGQEWAPPARAPCARPRPRAPLRVPARASPRPPRTYRRAPPRRTCRARTCRGARSLATGGGARAGSAPSPWQPRPAAPARSSEGRSEGSPSSRAPEPRACTRRAPCWIDAALRQGSRVPPRPPPGWSPYWLSWGGRARPHQRSLASEASLVGCLVHFINRIYPFAFFFLLKKKKTDLLFIMCVRSCKCRCGKGQRGRQIPGNWSCRR